MVVQNLQDADCVMSIVFVTGPVKQCAVTKSKCCSFTWHMKLCLT
jgi:hypothetical protein